MEFRKKAVAKNLETLQSPLPYEPCSKYSDHAFDGSVLNQYSLRIKDVVEKMEKSMEEREKEQQKLFMIFIGMSALGMFLVAVLRILGV